MYIDDYGNEFKTSKEVKEYAKENFYEDEDVLADALIGYFTLDTVIDWIVTNPTILKQFKESFAQDLKVIEEGYIEDYLFNCEERSDKNG